MVEATIASEQKVTNAESEQKKLGCKHYKRGCQK